MKRITILILVILFCLSGLAESTTWFCPNDGSENNGNFCMECGGARPTGWICPNCGTTGQNGNFCMECGAVRPQESSPETVFKCEGAGFDSPDDAVQSYIDALNAGDVPAMLSTFAIETYVDNMDAVEAIDRIRSVNTAGYYTVPVVGPYIRGILIERLHVALDCAKKYPNTFVVCTGGGTAAEDPTATEAGRMAEWLMEHGVNADRIIIEDHSLTTAQNAIYTFDILAQSYPQVKQLAIISSDYHIATGTLLFGAEAILRDSPLAVVSNAAWPAPSGTLSTMFQAGALIELSGDVDTAFEIYYDTYDIHELPNRG